MFSAMKYKRLSTESSHTCLDISQKCGLCFLHSSYWLLLLLISAGVVLHCVKDEHSAINMNLHYLENGCVMVNFIFQKELFFLPLGFALKVNKYLSVLNKCRSFTKHFYFLE